jgi:hypothetical protein
VRTNLRPMTLGEILDRVFQIYRQRVFSLVGVALIPALIMLGFHLADMAWFNVHSLFGPEPVNRVGSVFRNMVVALGFYHIGSLVGMPFSVSYVKQASSATLDEDCTLRSSLRFFRAGWLSYLWVTILKFLGELIGPELLAAGLFLAMGFSMDAAGLLNDNASWAYFFLSVVPTILGIYLFLWAGACLSLSMPAAAIEGKKGLKALKRSWVLSKDSRGRVITTWLLILVFGMVVSWGLQLLLRWGLTYLYWQLHIRQSAHFYNAVFYVFRAALASLLAPLYPIAITLFYYDQRIRREGFDIEWMMNVAGMNEPVPGTAAAFPAESATTAPAAQPAERPA